MPSSAISVTLPSVENDDRASSFAVAAGASPPRDRKDGPGGGDDDDDDVVVRRRQQQQQTIKGRGPLLAKSVSGLKSLGTSMFSLRPSPTGDVVPTRPPPRSSPDDDGAMAYAGTTSGPGAAAAHSGNALENYVIPSVLRMNTDASSSSTAASSTTDHQGGGMEVIKVSKVRTPTHFFCVVVTVAIVDVSSKCAYPHVPSLDRASLLFSSSLLYIQYKNGKQQLRRLGISPNNRAIYITSHRPQGLVMGLIKQGIVERVDEGGATGGGQMKEIDLSRVVRMQLGQQSRRFVKAR
jgi:hypothetical protein